MSQSSTLHLARRRKGMPWDPRHPMARVHKTKMFPIPFEQRGDLLCPFLVLLELRPHVRGGVRGVRGEGRGLRRRGRRRPVLTISYWTIR